MEGMRSTDYRKGSNMIPYLSKTYMVTVASHVVIGRRSGIEEVLTVGGEIILILNLHSDGDHLIPYTHASKAYMVTVVSYCNRPYIRSMRSTDYIRRNDTTPYSSKTYMVTVVSCCNRP